MENKKNFLFIENSLCLPNKSFSQMIVGFLSWRCSGDVGLITSEIRFVAFRWQRTLSVRRWFRAPRHAPLQLRRRVL